MNVNKTLPSGWLKREAALNSPSMTGRTVCVFLADAFLKAHANPIIDSDITIQLAIDPSYQAGEVISFWYKGTPYVDYLITRKKNDSKTNKLS